MGSETDFEEGLCICGNSKDGGIYSAGLDARGWISIKSIVDDGQLRSHEGGKEGEGGCKCYKEKEAETQNDVLRLEDRRPRNLGTINR